MAKMNKVETKAYNWLQKKGLSETDIIYQARRNPDFLTSDGKGYEAKKIYGKTLWFSSNQFEQLSNMTNVTILGFTDDKEEPTLILAASELREGILEGFHIRVVKDSGPPTYRNSYDLIAEIVKSCREPIGKTNILHEIRATHTIFERWLNMAVRFKLIEEVLGNQYHTTQKGRNFLKAWERLQTFLTEKDEVFQDAL